MKRFTAVEQREKFKQYQKERYLAKKAEIQKQQKEYRERNKDKIKQYYLEHKEEIQKQQKEYQIKRKEQK